jgi:hypothetical protein
MLKTVPRPLTVHDYRELPEGPPYSQLIEGDQVYHLTESADVPAATIGEEKESESALLPGLRIPLKEIFHQ